MTNTLNYLIIRTRIAALSLLIAAALASPVVAQENATTTGAQGTGAKPAAKAARSVKRTDGVRTLQEIKIEGEIAVPQVLFITSRENRRYRDGLGSTFRVSAVDVARSTDRPTRLRLVARLETSEASKEDNP